MHLQIHNFYAILRVTRTFLDNFQHFVKFVGCNTL